MAKEESFTLFRETMSAIEYPLLKSVTGDDGTRIWEWSYVDVSYARVFYKPRTDQPGFWFYALIVTTHSGMDDDKWTGDYTETDAIVRGNAYLDGVRHAHFGREGYIYYLHCSLLSRIMLALHELEKRYCDPKQIKP